MKLNLKELFLNLLDNYFCNRSKKLELWNEISEFYNSKGRYYHNLSHLEVMLQELMLVKNHINNWDSTLFAVFYHDIIYDINSFNNEEKSAELAYNRLFELKIPSDITDQVLKNILATKSHLKSTDNDINYFTDSDISIFGKNYDIYKKYFKNIRLEYSIYSNHQYIQGRIKVLEHFLNQEQIYKTDFFYNKYETLARKNIENELNKELYYNF